MWSTVDKWLGDNMFRPILIKACQKLDWTGAQLYRNMTALGMSIIAIALMPSVIAVLITLGAVYAIYKAVSIPAARREPAYSFMRFMWILLTIVQFIFAGPGALFGLWFTFAEYACTLDKIPPSGGHMVGAVTA